jgi:hypothetical protein
MGTPTEKLIDAPTADLVGLGQVPSFDRAPPKRDNKRIDVEKLQRLTVTANIINGVVY